MISAIGVRNVVENRVDFTNSRNLIIAAVILVCGLGFTDGLTFHVGGVTITLTSLAVAAIAFGLWRDAREKQAENEYIELPQAAELPSAASQPEQLK